MIISYNADLHGIGNHSTLCLKNDTDVAYNFNAHEPILEIFGRGIAKGISY